MHVGKFGTYDNNSTHGFINRQDSCNMGVGGAPASYVLAHNGDVYERGGKNRPKNNNNSCAEGEKNSLLLPSINPINPPGYHHIEM
jgi:hypothetical protein